MTMIQRAEDTPSETLCKVDRGVWSGGSNINPILGSE